MRKGDDRVIVLLDRPQGLSLGQERTFRRAIAYINAARVPTVKTFDEYFNPIGALLRRQMIDQNLITYSDKP